MIRRRAKVAGIAAEIGCHTFRATGITAYLANGGALKHAQKMAAHESPRTTKLYDRTKERLTQDELRGSGCECHEGHRERLFRPSHVAIWTAMRTRMEKASAAGKRICGGDFSGDNLQAIFRWKTKGRGISRLDRNTPMP